jgi:outer membrane protein assembly factor BamA
MEKEKPEAMMKSARYFSWLGVVALVAVSFAVGPVLAQEGDAAEPDSTDQDTSGFLLLPVIFYTPETKLAGGASFLRYFRPEGATVEARPSRIWATFILTQRGQYVADLYNELYFQEERYLAQGGINYQKFPDKFWGVGPDTPDSNEEDYTPETLSVYASLQNRISTSFHVGGHYDLAHGRISETEPGGLLDSGFLPGSEGGVISGVGAFIKWDTRDNIMYPTRGSYHSVAVKVYGSALGSDYDFAKYSIDLRHYIPIGGRFVLAAQGLFDASSGVVPFQKLAMLGGQNVLRGYYQGRYRDMYGVVGQVELRAQIFWRIGAAVFAGAGNVARRLDNFDKEYIRYSAGCGLRYTFDKDEHLNLRLDFGFGEESTGMYITALEAF